MGNSGLLTRYLLTFLVIDDRQRSTLSVYSTPASENQTLREVEATPPPPSHHGDEQEVEAQGEAREEAHEEVHEMSEVQHKLEELEHTELPPAPDVSFEQSVLEDTEAIQEKPKRVRKEKRPPTVIIEELDTPAIRREKNMARKRRREEERRLAEEAAAAFAALVAQQAASQPEPAAQPSAVSRLTEDVSDLSSLSSVTNDEDHVEDFKKGDDDDDESDYEEGDTSLIVVSAADARKAAQKAGLGPATLRIRDNEVLEGGTLGMYLRPL